jgi:hypothetical protein
MQLWNLTPLLKSANIKGFMKGTILFRMAMEVHGALEHGALEHDMDCFIRECASLFRNR